MENDFIEYLHNYAVWTAARAAQRGFTTTKNINDAINTTNLRNLVNKDTIVSANAFDEFHKETCTKIIFHLKKVLQESKGLVDKVTYGRAAKIVNIYLKTAVVIKDLGQSQLSKIVHPPIDSILLKKIGKEVSTFPFSKRKWTQMTEVEYFEVINEIRKIETKSLWKIEKYWSPIV